MIITISVKNAVFHQTQKPIRVTVIIVHFIKFFIFKFGISQFDFY